jgi:putative FmdB family regulatory protein
MPTYEYRCPAGHEFERFQKISDPVRVRCPECGRRASRIISGGAGLIFKGSGFYITDYGKDGKKPQGQPAKKDAPKPSESSSSDAAGGSKAGPTKDAGKSSESSTPKSSSPGSSGGE